MSDLRKLPKIWQEIENLPETKDRKQVAKLYRSLVNAIEETFEHESAIYLTSNDPFVRKIAELIAEKGRRPTARETGLWDYLNNGDWSNGRTLESDSSSEGSTPSSPANSDLMKLAEKDLMIEDEKAMESFNLRSIASRKLNNGS